MVAMLPTRFERIVKQVHDHLADALRIAQDLVEILFEIRLEADITGAALEKHPPRGRARWR